MECDCNPDRKGICPNCGQYGSEQSNYVHFGSDVHKDGHKEISVLPELTDFKLPDEVKISITMLYQKATQGKTKRNTPRRAIIFWSIVVVCKQSGIVFDSNNIQTKLSLKLKDINRAIKDIEPIIGQVTIQITIEDIIRIIMKSLNIQESCFTDIMDIYTICRKGSPLFNSSKTETLAYGLVFYYLSINLAEFDREVYFNNSTVSRDTILAIAQEIHNYIHPAP